MKIFQLLEGIFQTLSLDFCDSPGERILDSQEFSLISNEIPCWSELLHQGLKEEKAETLRTIRHVFRSLWVYFSILNDNFDSNIEKHEINLIKANLKSIHSYNPDFFPLILLYHDIGRPFDKEWHAHESARLILKNGLFERFELTTIQKKILMGVIKNHLLPGTIFTGESNYCGALSLFHDGDLNEIWETKEHTYQFFNSLMLFTIIDIWGYDYSKIFNHYFVYYRKIRDTLIDIFHEVSSLSLDPNTRYQQAYKRLREVDRLNFKWRVACALRIFQFVDTRPDQSVESYYIKIEQSLAEINKTWEEFATQLSPEHFLIQFKYALPIMMVLASETFFRKPMAPDATIKPELFDFWDVCIHTIKSLRLSMNKLSNDSDVLWNFIFELPWGWFLQKKYLKLVRSKQFLEQIRNCQPSFNAELNSYIIHVNLKE